MKSIFQQIQKIKVDEKLFKNSLIVIIVLSIFIISAIFYLASLDKSEGLFFIAVIPGQVLLLFFLLFSIELLKVISRHFLQNKIIKIFKPCFLYFIEGKEDISLETEYLEEFLIPILGNKKYNKFITSIQAIRGINELQINHFSFSTQDKIHVLSRLILIASCDDNFDAEERQRIENIAKKLRIPNKTLTRLIEKYAPEEVEEENFFEYFNFDIPVNTIKRDLNFAYDIFGLPEDSELELVKKEYRKLVKKYHPDKHQKSTQSEKEFAEKMFRKVQNAYDLICEK